MPAGLAAILTIQLLGGLASTVTPAAQAAGAPASAFGEAGTPKWDTFHINHGAYEPSIGANWNSGKAMYVAESSGTGAYSVWRLGFTDGATAATMSPANTGSSVINPDNLGDPILYTDPVTGRTWAGDIMATCTALQYTDNDGASWTTSDDACSYKGADHETIGSGPWANDPVTGAVPSIVTYSRAVYTCAQTASMQCAISYDGGNRFVPTSEVDVQRQCAGIHGHLRVSPDGTAYIPNRSCGSAGGAFFSNHGWTDGFAMTRDNGQSWSIVPVPQSNAGNRFDPSLAPTPGNWLYFASTEPTGGKGGAFVALTKDHGASFEDVGTSSGGAAGTKWFNVASLDSSIQDTEFPEIIAGDNERAAFAFLGSTIVQNDQANCGQPTNLWYLYVAMTYDAGKSWSLQKVTSEPMNQGSIQDGGTTADQTCRNLADFNDITVDKDGHVLIAYTDGCRASSTGTNACAADTSPPYGGIAAVARQFSGKGLFAAKDVTQPPANPVITMTTPAQGAIVGPILTLAGGVDRGFGSGSTLQVDAGGPYSAVAGTAIAITGIVTGASGAAACTWSAPAGISFGNSHACSTTVTASTATGSPFTLTLSATDSAATVSDTATFTVTVPATQACADDGPNGVAGIAPAAAPIQDITRVCLQTVGQDLVAVAKMALVVDTQGCTEYPVSWGFYFNDVPKPLEVDCFVGPTVGDFNLASAFVDTKATATVDAAAGTVTLRVPLSELAGVGAESPFSMHVETYNGPGAYGGRPMWIPAGITGAPLYFDRAPDAGNSPPTSAHAPALSAADPSGDSKVPGTDITDFGIVAGSETATTFQVQLKVADLGSSPPGAVEPCQPLPVFGVFCAETGASTSYTVDFYNHDPTATGGKVHYQVSAEDFTAYFPAVGPPAPDGHSYGLNVVHDSTGTGDQNFVTSVSSVQGTWNTASGTITWTIPKAAMVVKTAPDATGNGVMTGGTAPAAGRVLDTFTAETGTWVWAGGAGTEPGQTVWDDASGDDLSYTFNGGIYANPPGAPTGLTAAAGAGTVSLSWTAPANNGGAPITGYQVLYGTTNGGPYASTGPTGAGTTATVGGLLGGTAYYFVVVASNEAGPGPASTQASATPTAPPVDPCAGATGEHVEVRDATSCLGFVATATGAGNPTAAWTITLNGVAEGSHTYTARWVASGGAVLANSAARTVTVQVNHAPVLAAVGAKSVTAGSQLQVTLSATDPDAGDTVTYAIASGSQEGMALNGAVFSWTPTTQQASATPYAVVFQASDGNGGLDTKSSDITVEQAQATNHAPAIGVSPEPGDGFTVGEANALTFTVSTSDADNDAVTLTHDNLPAGASFNDGTGTFAWTPTYDQAGTYSVTFTASDGQTQTDKVVAITVSNTDRAPQMDAVNDVAVDEGDSVSFTVHASDADGDAVALSMQAATLPEGATFTDNGDGTGSFAWTTDATSGGSYALQFKATSGGLEATRSMTIVVHNTQAGGGGSSQNVAPVLSELSGPTAAVNVQSGATSDVTGTVFDGNGLDDLASVTYTVTPDPRQAGCGEAPGCGGFGPLSAALQMPANGDGSMNFRATVSFPARAAAGDYVVEVTATDSAGATDTAQYTITVRDDLAPTVHDLSGIEAALDAQLSQDRTVTGVATDLDGAAGLALGATLSGTNGPVGSATVTAGTADGNDLPFTVAVHLPAGTAPGAYTLTVTATDTAGQSGSDVLGFTVTVPVQVTLGFSEGTFWNFGEFGPNSHTIQTQNALILGNDLGSDADLLFNAGDGIMHQLGDGKTGQVPLLGHSHLIVSTGTDPAAPDLPSVPYDGTLVHLGVVPAGQHVNVWLSVDDLPAIIPSGQYGFTFGIGHTSAPPAP